MKLSCGIVIINDQNEILLGHSTGNKLYDIPKGAVEPGESNIETAIRECQEETGLIFRPEQLKDKGIFKYNKYKDLHLFTVRFNIEELEKLKCTSYFINPYTKKEVPEFDSFKLVKISEIDNYCIKNMCVSLNRFFSMENY